ncbi:hypothetical protein ACF0H5_018236 [Mactra antiquata]
MLVNFVFVICILSLCKCDEPKSCSQLEYLGDILERMVRIELKAESLDKELSKTNSEAMSALEELKLERERFRSDISVFENQIKAEKERAELDRANIENNMKQLKQEREQFKSDIAIYENQIKAEKEQAGLDKTKLESELKELIGERFQNEMNSMRELMLTPNILFKAKNVKDRSISYRRTILFTDIIMNNGNGYDSKTGVFTAPVNGTYLFIIHMCLKKGKIFEYNIVRDRNVHTSGRFCGDKLYISCHSANAVMYLSVRQRVRLVCSSTPNVSYYTNALDESTSSRYWNTFTGMIVHL